MVRRSVAIAFGTLACFVVSIASFCAGWVVSARYDGLLPGSVAAAVGISQSASMGTPQGVRSQFEVFWEVWQLVNTEFYHTKPIDQQKLVYGAINGMLAALGDEYTTFQEPDVAAQTRDSMHGSFEGIGTYVRVEQGKIMIDRPIKGSPAAKVGLLSGDVILKVDGKELAPQVAGLSDADAAAKAASLIRGPKGSPVALTLQRGERVFEVSLIRDSVPLISVNAEMLDNGIAYIQITEFRTRTTDELDEALRELMPKQPRAIVLDLRNNYGGYLETAQEVLGRFYTGTALFERHSDGSITSLDTLPPSGSPMATTQPLIVLVNANSASASEIVAGALRDERPNTFLLGDKSYGKGSVQNIHTLRDGSSVRITIAQWLTPSREAIHKLGITPQYQVPFSDESRFSVPCIVGRKPTQGNACTDSQLFWALKVLNGEGTPPAVAVSTAP